MMTSAGQKNQAGAVTLMGALFIIITLALMVLAINRMAASNITDTAIQNDAVDALFIAETGIEYASYLYANGTACVDLNTTIGNTVSGRGSFDVTASALNGSDCSITVQASVSSVGAGSPDASLRVIDADLRPSIAGGWAVGDNGTILEWNGTDWIAAVSNTTEDLNSIHCESSNNCWAVGDNGETVRWDGTTWSPVASGTSGALFGVSCSAGNSCYSVGLGLLSSTTRYWNGTAWVNGGGGALFSAYSDVSCPSANCYSTRFGFFGSSIHASATSWGTVFTGSIQLNGIDCAAANDCWAVGDLSGNNYYFVHYDGSNWTSQTVSPSGNNVRRNLNAVSCSGINDCWAVGDVGSGRFVLVHWDGSNWISSPTHFQSGTYRETLNGVHCPSSNECWAVGVPRNGWNIISYNGTAWGHVGSAAVDSGGNALTPVTLNDVFVFDGSGSGGGVSLVRWQEQINN